VYDSECYYSFNTKKGKAMHTDFNNLIKLLDENEVNYTVKTYYRFCTVYFDGHTVDFYRGGKLIAIN
jgi:hypothetical protein